MLIIMLMTAVMTRVVVVVVVVVAVIMTKFFPKALFWQILSLACTVGINFEVFN